MNAQCALCLRLHEPTPPLGGWIRRDPHWAVSGHPGVAVPGWLAVQTVRHVTTLADLSADEAMGLGPLIRDASRWVQEATGAERTYSYTLGENVRHVHVLLGPPISATDPDGQGARLLSRILQRDATIEDPDTTLRLLSQIARLAEA
jgi:diadenosine tetraphosphate (Ap4A) HIT family hydrolase